MAASSTLAATSEVFNRAAEDDKSAADVPTLKTRRYLDVKATAARLGYSSQYIVTSIEEGRLPALNIARDPGKMRPEYRIQSEAMISHGTCPPWHS